VELLIDNAPMKEYKSCFIGIPLPDEYLGEFSSVLEKVKALNPSLDTVDPATPHITIYYLDRQPETNLDDIKKVVEQHVPLIRDDRLLIGGMETFGEGPNVLFLPVGYPKSLMDFASAVSDEAAKFVESDTNLPFHPHMTVAYFNEASKQTWENTKNSISVEMGQIKWDFSITEVAIYGDTPFRKLITIPV
jgi:2'-5' RNA ligase